MRLMASGVLAASLVTAACHPVQEHAPKWSKAAAGAAAQADTGAKAPAGASAKASAKASAEASAEASSKASSKAVAAQFAVAPPPFSDGVFPCSECHGKTDVVNRTPHAVEFHEDIVLRHDEKNRWCLDCHDAQNRDKLHLADGRLVDFTESYKLCGQCHGPTLRNWKAGEHGKRTGMWNGDKQYLLCASCHSPHSPGFKPIKPMPSPKRQEAVR